MLYRTALAASLAPLAAAFSVTINSNCGWTVYGWNVADNYGSGAPTFELAAGDNWSGPFEDRTNGGGVSIKLKKTNNIFDGEAQNQVEYKMAGSTLFYDLSNINGDCFVGEEVIMKTSNSGCPSVTCQASDPVCNAAYLHPNDERTLACPGGADIVVNLCSGSGSGSGSSSSPKSIKAPAPAPPKPQPTTLSKQPVAPSPKPQQQQHGNNFLQEDDSGDVAVAIVTKVVAVTVTSTAHGSGPTPPTVQAREAEEQEKREPHIHQHVHRGRSHFKGVHAL